MSGMELDWSTAMPWILGAAAVGYFLGSIPFGLIFGRMAGLGDIRDIGSGSIGATNALRTGNRWVAAATLICDVGKGALAVALALRFAPEGAGLAVAMAAAIASFLGHLFPVWLGFKGGKGVATFIGINLALYWPAGILFCATWLAVAAIFRKSSLAALLAAIATPGFLWLLHRPDLVPLSLLLVALIYVAHRDNIRRLAAGTEPRIGSQK